MSASTQGPILQAVGLGKRYRVRGGRTVVAVDTFDLSLEEGTTVALVGESGSGKSTVARLLAQLTLPSEGKVLLRGRPVRIRGSRARRRYVGDVQLLLQDPFASLNPAHTIHYQLSRVLKLHGFTGGRQALEEQLEELLKTVRMLPPQQFLSKYPHELSGGQLQRVAIARTLAADPSVLLLDEPVSMLDVSIRLGILNLLAALKKQRNLASLYITHDIASARYFADEIIVMYRGHVVERGPAESVTQHPAHPYTQLLIESAPDPTRRGENKLVSEGTGRGGGAASSGEPKGCPFARRCPFAMPICSAEMPPVSHVDQDGHDVRCWLNDDQKTERPELVASV